MADWRKGLSKAHKKHLQEMECTTKASFQRTLDYHAKLRLLSPLVEPCWECRDIARKLGMDGKA